MKRYLNWVLGALAAATAVAALFRKREETPEVAAPVAQGIPEGPQRWQRRMLTLLNSVRIRMQEHHIPLIAGSLSYYAFLAIFPAALAAIAIYGLVLDPSQLAAHIASITSALPQDTSQFISDELTKIVTDSGSGLGFTAILSIVGALWAASAGTKALMTGIDIAYDTPEDRPFLIQRAMALGITVGLIVFVAVAGSAVTFLPDLLDALGAPGLIRFVQYGSWPIIFITVIVGLGVLFKIAPNRPASESPWISVGAVVVAFLWLLSILGLSIYSSRAGRLGATYGVLTGVIVLMLWFFISGLIVLFGAELNAELEARDLAHLGHNGRS